MNASGDNVSSFTGKVSAAITRALLRPAPTRAHWMSKARRLWTMRRQKSDRRDHRLAVQAVGAGGPGSVTWGAVCSTRPPRTDPWLRGAWSGWRRLERADPRGDLAHDLEPEPLELSVQGGGEVPQKLAGKRSGRRVEQADGGDSARGGERVGEREPKELVHPELDQADAIDAGRELPAASVRRASSACRPGLSGEEGRVQAPRVRANRSRAQGKSAVRLLRESATHLSPKAKRSSADRAGPPARPRRERRLG